MRHDRHDPAAALALRVALESRCTGVSPWSFRRALLTGALYRGRSWRERLALRLTSFLVAWRAVRLLRE